MNPMTNRTMIVLTFLALAAGTFAQDPSPREQFPAAVAAYQKSPTREAASKVIELYKQLDPLPAVPEEARRPFVMGATVLKKANDKVGAAKAIEFFTDAIKTAPWFAEAYYNRALAREITGQFTEAMDDLKLYLAFTLSDTERRDAQDKIYSLEADAQLSEAKKTEEKNREYDREIAAAKRQDLVGHWKVFVDGHPQVAGGSNGKGGTWIQDFHYRFEKQGKEIAAYIVSDSDPLGIEEKWLQRNGGGWAGKGDEELWGKFAVDRNAIKGRYLWNKNSGLLSGTLKKDEIQWEYYKTINGIPFPIREILRRQD